MVFLGVWEGWRRGNFKKRIEYIGGRKEINGGESRDGVEWKNQET